MKKNVEKFLTIPFDEIFTERVYVDIEADVVYDKVVGVAIGYIHRTRTCIEIIFKWPEIVNDNFETQKESLWDYLNQDYVIVRDVSKYYFRVNNGYILICNHGVKTDYVFRLPRLFEGDDAEEINPDLCDMDSENFVSEE